MDTSWMLPWHISFSKESRRARFKVIVAHRKAKKTLYDIKELDRWAQAVPAVYWLVEPTLAQGKKIVWDDPDMFQRNVLPYAWEHRNITDHYLQYPNGSKIYLLGGRSPSDLRGPNPLGVVLDEYDDMHPDVWKTVQPIFTANPDAWCIISGTYKGKKDLYAKMQYALQHMGDWFGFTLKASESGIISDEALAEAKATTTQAFYDMEYECIPIEGGLSFFTRIRDNLWNGVLGQLDGREFKLGLDLGKINDWTVITPVDLMENQMWGNSNPFLVGVPERFNQIDWPLQKARIEASYYRYNKAEITMDATGIGGPIVDDLRAKNIKPLEAFTFTEKSRMDLLRNLQIMIAQDKVRIPNYDPLLLELEAVSYDVTRTGRTTIGVPDGQHDDCVMSLALAVWGAKKRKTTKAAYQNIAFHDNTDDLWKGGNK